MLRAVSRAAGAGARAGRVPVILQGDPEVKPHSAGYIRGAGRVKTAGDATEIAFLR